MCRFSAQTLVVVCTATPVWAFRPQFLCKHWKRGELHVTMDVYYDYTDLVCGSIKEGLNSTGVHNLTFEIVVRW